MILAKNIHKFYDNNHILKGIDININRGEIISLVGASGAGKTTLLQILGTIDSYNKKEKSTLLLNNHDVSIMSNDELARFRNQEIGFVFQFHQLLPEFTAIENIFLSSASTKPSFEIILPLFGYTYSKVLIFFSLSSFSSSPFITCR